MPASQTDLLFDFEPDGSELVNNAPKVVELSDLITSTHISLLPE